MKTNAQKNLYSSNHEVAVDIRYGRTRREQYYNLGGNGRTSFVTSSCENKFKAFNALQNNYFDISVKIWPSI